MSALLKPISLSELRNLPAGKLWLVDQPIAGLASLTPVRGRLQVVHHGTALEVSADAEAIVTLCCARCLQQFNHVLRAEVQELIEFRNSPSSSSSPSSIGEGTTSSWGDDLDDRLDPGGSFDPERWLFEQLSLQHPLVNRCGEDCPGPDSWGTTPTGTDPRWEALRALRPSASASAPSAHSPNLPSPT